MTNITSVTVGFGNGIKREEYGPVKKAEASITACVAEDEDGEAVLAEISKLALAQVAALLDAPKPNITVGSSGIVAQEVNVAADAAQYAVDKAAGEAPPRRGRGRPKKEETPAETAEQPTDTAAEASQPATAEAEQPAATPAEEDEWAAGSEAIEITDAELLAATSKRAGELGAREPIVKLIATFATRTEGAPFKVQEIPQAQRKDYLAKLAALTA